MEPLPELNVLLRSLRQQKKSQADLARVSGVPQSVISRIMSGGIKDPSYKTMRKILLAAEVVLIHDASGLKEMTAQHLMNNKVVSAWPDDKLCDAWEIMKKGNFSQLPVIDQRDRPMGSISESFVFQHNSQYDLERRLDDLEIEDAFPTVGKNTSLSTVADILKTRQAILVVERGKVNGIITRHDVIEKA
jgi:predicted transcriptional regulator